MTKIFSGFTLKEKCKKNKIEGKNKDSKKRSPYMESESKMISF